MMSRWVKYSVNAICLGIVLAAFSGCAHIRAGSLEAVKPTSDAQRAGNVYLVRGWIGIWSFGMDQLSSKLTDQGIRCNVYQDAQTDALAAELVKIYRDHPDHEPIVLIGHSLGADDVIKLARALDEASVQVELLVTVDPVLESRIPKNVKTCLNYYRPNGAWDNLPMFRGIRVEPDRNTAGKVQNIDIVNDRSDLLEEKTTHFNIDKNPKVHAEIIRNVMATLPPRPKWLAMHPGAPLAAGADSEVEAGSSDAASSMTSISVDGNNSRPVDQGRLSRGQAIVHDPANFDPRTVIEPRRTE